MKDLLCAASLCAGLAISCVSVVATADDNFPIYRGTSGETDAPAEPTDGPGIGAVATATAEIFPDCDDWLLLVQLNTSAAGLGNHWGTGAEALCGYTVLDNAQYSPHGKVVGIALTELSGTGMGSASIFADYYGFAITETASGVFVTFNGDPIDITSAGSGIPLEVTLPASPGSSIYLHATASIAAGDNGDQCFASAAASVVPVESLPQPKVVVRDYYGDVAESWEYVPPPPGD